MPARVAIIDDRQTNLRIYSQFVTMLGPEFEPICFADPEEALGWLDSHVVDLLIVDYRMPQMNGAEFIRRVRTRHLTADVPAIVITAHQDRECRLAALDAGATDFLQSPVGLQEFRSRALPLVEQRQRKSALARRASQLDRGAVRSSREQSQPKSMLEQIIDTISIMICATDRDGRILFINAYQAALMNNDPEAVVGRPLAEFLTPGLAERTERRNAIVLATGEPMPHFEEEVEVDGVELTFHCTKNPIVNHDGETVGVLTTGVDITARKFAEEHRTHLALHDMLTGLPNRALLAERLRETIEECLASGEQAALLLVDLDRFKVINDSRGHQAGDVLLREVSKRIAEVCGKDFAARIGGDEFAIILRNVPGPDAIADHCQRLLRAIHQPFRINGVDQVVGASIGIALIPEDGTCRDELLRLSDLAMYDAKARGRNGFCFFSPQLNQVAQANAQLEVELRRALAREELALEYQPIFDARSRHIVGLEALLRWNHPVRGRLLPTEFLHIADEIGLGPTIGRWVVRSACKQIGAFTDAGIDPPRVAVNISPLQFQTGDIAGETIAEIRAQGIDPGRLSIEITEEIFLYPDEAVKRALRRLLDAGVDIAIDDFGTGYSSLQYLRDLPARRLKIDRTFVERIAHSAADRAIVATVSHLAHALGMRVVAEGIESEEQVAILRTTGCDELQGFFLGRPLSAEQLTGLFADRAPAAGQAC